MSTDNSNLNKRFNNKEWYYIKGEELNKIWKVAQRLYTELKLKDGDEYRDLAQTLDISLNNVIENDTLSIPQNEV